MLLARVGVVIPAAGQGRRMGAPVNKLFLELGGLPVLAWALRMFEASFYVDEIVVVGAPEDLPKIQELIDKHRVAKISALPPGGACRQESVLAGVRALSPATQRVVVHDGARPLLTLTAFHRFLEAAAVFPAAVMAVPVKDTIKEVDADECVTRTLVRENLRAVQTPQIFDRCLLLAAHEHALSRGFWATDDASLVEFYGEAVRVIAGDPQNIKVTTPEDLWLAEQILLHRSAAL